MVKRALILANERNPNLDYKDILEKTRGIAFICLQYERSDSAGLVNFDAILLMSASIGISTKPVLVSNLVKSSTTLVTISNKFVDRARDMMIYIF